MDKESFGNIVAEALDSLPEQFQSALDNVEILVEDWPDQETMRLAKVGSPYSLLGFYHGVPLTHRTAGYNLVPPDKISIYQMPIEAQCRTEKQVAALTARVVRHELGHFFGLSDARLHDLGAY